MTFAEFVEKWTGRDLEYHERAETTGFIFAEACWNAALECAAAEAEDVASVGDTDAIAESILRMRSNVEVTGAARLHRAASSDRRERGRPPGWAPAYARARQTELAQESARVTRRLDEARR